MGKKQQLLTFPAASVVITVVILWWMVYPTVGCSGGSGGACEECIANQMKQGCPGCAPILQCMAKCLWGGSSRSKCIKKCDCDGAMLTLSDCKKCMSTCKCSCVAYT